MQGGGGEARDGVTAGLSEETHGAEGVATEERSGRAEGDMSALLVCLTQSHLRYF